MRGGSTGAGSRLGCISDPRWCRICMSCFKDSLRAAWLPAPQNLIGENAAAFFVVCADFINRDSRISLGRVVCTLSLRRIKRVLGKYCRMLMQDMRGKQTTLRKSTPAFQEPRTAPLPHVWRGLALPHVFGCGGETGMPFSRVFMAVVHSKRRKDDENERRGDELSDGWVIVGYIKLQHLQLQHLEVEEELNRKSKFILYTHLASIGAILLLWRFFETQRYTVYYSTIMHFLPVN